MLTMLPMSFTQSSIAPHTNYREESPPLPTTNPQQLQKAWLHALAIHTAKLETAFLSYKKGDANKYKMFKAREWAPPFNHEHEAIYQYWFSIPERSSEKYKQLHRVFNAWASLNNASIYMQYYLNSGSHTELDRICKKLSTVKSVLTKMQQPEGVFSANQPTTAMNLTSASSNLFVNCKTIKTI